MRVLGKWSVGQSALFDAGCGVGLNHLINNQLRLLNSRKFAEAAVKSIKCMQRGLQFFFRMANKWCDDDSTYFFHDPQRKIRLFALYNITNSIYNLTTVNTTYVPHTILTIYCWKTRTSSFYNTHITFLCLAGDGKVHCLHNYQHVTR